jgi:threonine dehydrogenase-like Zn-dependent dehydrogenase
MKGYGMIKIEEPGWIEKPKPEIGELDALVKPIAVAPCSSDTHALHGGAGPKENLILGHEAVGEVVEVGNLVKKFKPGDKVVVATTTPNWEGDISLQERDINNAHEGGLMGSFKFLISKDGVLAEYFSVNNADTNLVLLPEDMDIKAALMSCDMMSTGIYAAENAEIKLGDSVVVFGIGPVGLMAVAGARLLGAGRIYATGTRPNCIELAKEYGATDIINYKEGDVVEQILALEGGKVDRVIIAGGNAKSMNQALQLVKNNGNISNVNFFDIKDVFNVPALEWGLGMSDVTIKCGFCPGGAYRIEKMLNLVKYGRVDPSKLINYEFHGFDKIEDAFKLMDEKPRDLIKPAVFIDDL